MGLKKSKVYSTALTEQQIKLLLGNTNFTREEIIQWHEGFLRDCPNGRLDKKKFVAIYQQFFPQGDVKDYCKYAFDTFDTNDDGTIDFNEFLLCIAATQQGDPDRRLELAFDLYDTSNDGQIDQHELAKMIDALYDLNGVKDRSPENNPKARAAAIIAALDVTGDKKLSREEFISACKNDPQIRSILAPNA